MLKENNEKKEKELVNYGNNIKHKKEEIIA